MARVMASSKKGLELVFDLQWNKADNDDDESNIIGMYDTPVTTLNFETFKSYLLKNSGVAGNDVKVIYVTDDGFDWVIENEAVFQRALFTFRLKARLREHISLKLSKTLGAVKRAQRVEKESTDVQTQFDNRMEAAAQVPPEWFLSFMDDFRRDLIDEITAVTRSFVVIPKKEVAGQQTPEVAGQSTSEVAAQAPVKEVSSVPSAIHIRKARLAQSWKARSSRSPEIDRQLKRTLKYDHKLDQKLDRLSAKTKKIKEKKEALFINQAPVKDEILKTEEPEPNHKWSTAMSGKSILPIGILHMMGEEAYLHTWKLTNDGTLPWADDTELRLEWGTTGMKPSTECLRCPALKPKEKISLSVVFHVPRKPGRYESYWSLYTKEHRFGQSIGFRVLVGHPAFKPEYASKKPKYEPVAQTVVMPITMVDKPLAEIQTVHSTDLDLPFKPDHATAINGKEYQRFVTEALAKPASSETTEFQRILTKAQDDFVQLTLAAESDSELSSATESSEDDSDDCIKYGISEKELTVDLSNLKEVSHDTSQNSLFTGEAEKQSPNCDDDVVKDGASAKSDDDFLILSSDHISDDSLVEVHHPEHDDSEIPSLESAQATNQDDNNNGEVIPGESESVASDLSSSYDMINAPVCNENVQESEFVIVYCGSHELKVPKSIVRPELLAPVSKQIASSTEDGNSSSPVKEPSSPPRTIAPLSDLAKMSVQADMWSRPVYTYIPDSLMSHCSTAGSCFSDVNSACQGNSSRKFVFPQETSGYELVGPKNDEVPKTRIVTGNIAAPTTEKIQFSSPPGPNTEGFVEHDAAALGTRRYPTVLRSLYDDAGMTAAIAATAAAAAAADAAAAARPLMTSQEEANFFPQPYGFMDGAAAARPSMTPQEETNFFPQHHGFPHVPNYQQSPRDQHPVRPEFADQHLPRDVRSPPCLSPEVPTQSVPMVHILPENLVSGAVNVASSAINTARSVIKLMIPPKAESGKWVNGHWEINNPDSLRAKNLKILAEMGFWDQDLNASLLARYNDDVNRVISDLIQ